MKFFTRESWLAIQKPSSKEFERQQDALQRYRSQLEILRSRLDAETFKFFMDADVHDGELLDLRIMDGSRPAPLTEAVYPWKCRRDHPVKVNLKVLDANDQFVWELDYHYVRRILVDFPNEPLFYHEGEGFGDWGYHELSEASGEFLQHEILFASGSVLLFEFKNVSIKATPRSVAAKQNVT